MSLRIRKLATTCYVPRPHADIASVVDELARGRFATDLTAHLGPSLGRQPAIVRIRGLSLRVIVPEPELTAEALSLAWAQAFLKALFTALQYPSGTGPIEIFRAESTTAYIAGTIRDLLDGVAGTRWYYSEFQELFKLGNIQAALALVCQWSDETLPVLCELARMGGLEPFLSRIDDHALARVFVALADTTSTIESPAFADILEAARLALSGPAESPSIFRTRRYALRQFVDARRSGRWPQSARTLFHAFRLIWRLMTEGFATLWDVSQPGDRLSTAFTQSPELSQLTDILTAELVHRPQSPQLAELTRAVEQLRLRLQLPMEPDAPSPVRWIASKWAGLFFLTSTLESTRWIPAWKRLADFEHGGISPLIAGIALSIAGQFEPDVTDFDPGLAIFAGYDDETDLTHLQSIFAGPLTAGARSRVLGAAFPEPQREVAESWRATFDALANELVQRFASKLRGFREASRAGIVRTFLERPGHIAVSENRIQVAPDPSPYHVVVHIAGMDVPSSRVSWMGDRRLEFEVGDL